MGLKCLLKRERQKTSALGTFAPSVGTYDHRYSHEYKCQGKNVLLDQVEQREVRHRESACVSFRGHRQPQTRSNSEMCCYRAWSRPLQSQERLVCSPYD